jgi:hypothetical protein
MIWPLLFAPPNWNLLRRRRREEGEKRNRREEEQRENGVSGIKIKEWKRAVAASCPVRVPKTQNK